MRSIVEAAGFRWILEGHGDGFGPSPHEAGEVEDTLLGLVKPGSVFLDVGAHVGHYTLRASRIAERVIAVEANPNTARRLWDNIELNGITNVSVFCVAAWDEPIILHLESPNHQDRDGSMRVLPGLGEVIVRGEPLDEVLPELDRVDLIKLDVEGADLHALRGMQGIIAKHRPTMFIEDHSIYGFYRRSDLMSLLDEFGYRVRYGGAYGTAMYWVAIPKEVSNG